MNTEEKPNVSNKIFIKSEKELSDIFKSTDHNCSYNLNDKIETEENFNSPMVVINEYNNTKSGFTEILFKTDDIEEEYTCEEKYDPLMLDLSNIKKEIKHKLSLTQGDSVENGKKIEKKNPCRTCILQSAKKATNILPTLEQSTCEFCSFLANESQIYKINFASDTGKMSFSCELCPYKTNQKSSIKKHCMIHTGEKPYSCDLCSFKAGQKSTIKTHMLTHTGEDSYSCHLCPYKGKSMSRLRKHYLTHTDKPKCNKLSAESNTNGYMEKTLNCTICSFTANRQCILKRHHLTHTANDQKLFSCELCPYKSDRKLELKMHYVTHSKEKQYECDFCLYKTNKKGILNQHYASHARKQLIPCELCSYMGTKKNLDIHMLLHTDDNLFSRSLGSIRK